MTRQEILEFANKNPICFLATCENNKPFVRAVMLYCADENGLLFSTWRQKDLYRQITINPLMEVCFYDSRQGKQLRVRGLLEQVNDDHLKKVILTKFRFLKVQANRSGLESMAVFKLSHGEATAWSLAEAFEEKHYFPF